MFTRTKEAAAVIKEWQLLEEMLFSENFTCPEHGMLLPELIFHRNVGVEIFWLLTEEVLLIKPRGKF